MFTLNHFIWLGICTIAIAALFLLDKYRKLSFDTVLNIAVVGSVISECVKMFSNMVDGYKGGMHLNPGDLPFHLCSIQIFLFFALKYFAKSEDTKQRFLGFMTPVAILGGIMALLIPTVGVEFTAPQVYQFFLYHAMLIFFAIYVIKNGLVRWSFGVLLRNLRYLGAVCFFATIINSMLYESFNKVNFFYLVRPPMDNLPILNLDNGWYAYIASLLLIAVVLVTALHALLIFIQGLREKKDNTHSN